MATTVVRSHAARRRVLQVTNGTARWRDDMLAVEEPVEIRLYTAGSPAYMPVAVTMRTPGHDFELAAGFLYTEGILTDVADVRTIAYCGDVPGGSMGVRPEERYNLVNVYLREGVTFDAARLDRHFYTTSSCGICGKASLEAVRLMGVQPIEDDVRVHRSVLETLGDRLRAAQRVFDRTGGLHAAGWFRADGELVALREDVGRHNAVDKIVGHAFLERKTPVRDSILMVSGRASFEIVQKAAVAGFAVIAAISAPSSLACDAADDFGITLVGFLRGERFNVYTHPDRVVLED